MLGDSDSVVDVDAETNSVEITAPKKEGIFDKIGRHVYAHVYAHVLAHVFAHVDTHVKTQTHVSIGRMFSSSEEREQQRRRRFKFDAVFAASSAQHDIFDRVGMPVLRHGYNRPFLTCLYTCLYACL